MSGVDSENSETRGQKNLVRAQHCSIAITQTHFGSVGFEKWLVTLENPRNWGHDAFTLLNLTVIQDKSHWMLSINFFNSFSGSILVACWLLLTHVDFSVLYHTVRGQSVIKLYVIYNMLEVKNLPHFVGCYMSQSRKMGLWQWEAWMLL